MGKIHSDVLNNVILFSLRSTTLWSGRGRLTAEDLGDVADRLPPAALASLGSKRLFPPNKIKALQGFKRRMARTIATCGAPWMGGRAVPVAVAESCAQALEGVIIEANAFVEKEVLGDFDTIVTEWQAENPRWAGMLSAGTPERDAVRARIRFDYDAYPVGVPDGEMLSKKMRENVLSLGTNMLNEIASESRDFVKRVIETNRKLAPSQKTIRALRELATKLRTLSFMDHHAVPLCDLANAVLALLPDKGRLTADQLMVAIQLGNALGEIDTMKSIAQRMLAGATVAEEVERMVGVKVAEPEATNSMQMLFVSGESAGEQPTVDNGAIVVEPHVLSPANQVISEAEAQAVDSAAQARQLPEPLKAVEAVVEAVVEALKPPPVAPAVNAMRRMTF